MGPDKELTRIGLQNLAILREKIEALAKDYNSLSEKLNLGSELQVSESTGDVEEEPAEEESAANAWLCSWETGYDPSKDEDEDEWESSEAWYQSQSCSWGQDES